MLKWNFFFFLQASGFCSGLLKKCRSPINQTGRSQQVVPHCISKEQIKLFLSWSPCTYNADMLQKKVIRFFETLLCLILCTEWTATLASLFFLIMCFLPVDVTILAFSKLYSLFLWNITPFLSACISTGLITLGNIWFSCGLLLFAAWSCQNTLAHWNHPRVAMLGSQDRGRALGQVLPSCAHQEGTTACVKGSAITLGTTGHKSPVLGMEISRCNFTSTTQTKGELLWKIYVDRWR